MTEKTRRLLPRITQGCSGRHCTPPVTVDKGPIIRGRVDPDRRLGDLADHDRVAGGRAPAAAPVFPAVPAHEGGSDGELQQKFATIGVQPDVLQEPRGWAVSNESSHSRAKGIGAAAEIERPPRLIDRRP